MNVIPLEHHCLHYLSNQLHSEYYLYRFEFYPMFLMELVHNYYHLRTQQHLDKKTVHLQKKFPI